MDDVDPTLGDDALQGAPDLRVEGMTFPRLDIIDIHPAGASIDRKDLVSCVADVANRYGETLPVGLGGALQDGLFGAATGPAHAPQLENRNAALGHVAMPRRRYA